MIHFEGIDLDTVKSEVIKILYYIPRQEEMKNYTDHGRGHSERLVEIITDIINVCTKNEIELNDLEKSLLHDFRT